MHLPTLENKYITVEGLSFGSLQIREPRSGDLFLFEQVQEDKSKIFDVIASLLDSYEGTVEERSAFLRKLSSEDFTKIMEAFTGSITPPTDKKK